MARAQDALERPNYFRKSINISVISRLITSIVVNGKNSRKPGRSIRKSPGSRPSGSLEIHGQASPTSAMTMPRANKARCTVET